MDFVARQEHLGDDLADLVDHINMRRDAGGRGGCSCMHGVAGSMRRFGAHSSPPACTALPACLPTRGAGAAYPPLAGVGPLALAEQLGTAKMRPRCASGRSEAAAAHGVGEMQQGELRWQGMVAREQYCTTDEYYAGRHEHCRASIAAYYADDLRLLYGGAAR